MLQIRRWLELAFARVASRFRGLGDPWLVASRVGLLALLGCVAGFSTDAGLIWDEPLQRKYGDFILAWFKSGFRDRSAFDYRDLYLYGGLFDAPAQWLTTLSPLGPYETRHVLCALVAVIGVIASFNIAHRLGGARAGFLAAASLVLIPAWTGHGLFNPKDIPFASAAAFVCYASVQIALGPAPLSWRSALFGGLCVGLALAVRSGGIFLFGYVVCTALARAALELVERVRRNEASGWPRLFGSTLLRLAVAAAIAWALMLSFWPWAQVSPFEHPLSAAREAMAFEWHGKVLFRGRMVQVAKLPWSYLPTWFGITLPECIFVALLAGLFVLGLRFRPRALVTPRGLALAFLGASVLVPLLGAVVLRPIIYDGQRHFLFLLPPLAALAGVALSSCLDALRDRRQRAVFALLWLASAGLAAVDMVELHPYEYAYFNRISGGLRRAARRFETDYWGASYREGLAWLLENVKPDPKRRLLVSNCSTPDQTEYYLARSDFGREHFAFVEDIDRADLLLATTRYNCHRRPGTVLHKLKRQGVSLLYVIELPRKLHTPKRGHKKKSSPVPQPAIGSLSSAVLVAPSER